MPTPKDPIPPAHSAKIVGCGQKHFFSQKSGLSFPAFLIQFSYFSEEVLHHYYQWRSKKCFLLLKREKVTCSHDGLHASKDFPKNAFSNLCEQASSDAWLKPLIGELENKQHAIATAIGNDISHLNLYLAAYQPRMKKSIMRLEDFINNYRTFTNNWARFCREEDSDNIRTIDPKDFRDKDYKTVENGHFLATKLGQYFTSKDVARKVRNAVFSRFVLFSLFLIPICRLPQRQ